MLQLGQGCATKQTKVNEPHLLVEEHRGGDSLNDAVSGLGQKGNLGTFSSRRGSSWEVAGSLGSLLGGSGKLDWSTRLGNKGVKVGTLVGLGLSSCAGPLRTLSVPEDAGRCRKVMSEDKECVQMP
jgi:hypothetical protein